MEKTLSIVKPDAVAAGHTGDILAMFEKQGLKVVAGRMLQMDKATAEKFYAVHSERPFFNDLTDFMSSGPVFVSVLEGEDAIKRNRDIMGATNPAEATDGTIRKLYGASIDNNAVHGSDAPETAAVEIAFFFASTDIQDYKRA